MGYVLCALLLNAAGARAAGSASPAVPDVNDTEHTGTTVFAELRWSGLCSDRRALEKAMQQRGAQLRAPGAATPRVGRDQFTIDVDVHPASGEQGYAARITLSSKDGAHDVREVKASKCDELHSAVAWVLVVLARGPRISDGKLRESDAKATTNNGLSEPDPAGDAMRKPDSAALAVAPGSWTPDKGQLGPFFVQGHVAVRAHPRYTLGAQLVASWLFMGEPALGPAVFLEHRPWRDRTLAVRLSLLTLANETAITGSEVGVSARRTAVSLRALLQAPGVPLALTSGLEAGLLSARGSGALVSHQSERAWGAWLLGILLELPLLRDRLWFGTGGDVAICPFTYAFHTTSERTMVESGPIELRASAGLKSSF